MRKNKKEKTVIPEEEIEKAQKEFENKTAQVTVFLSANGLAVKSIKELLKKTVDQVVDKWSETLWEDKKNA